MATVRAWDSFEDLHGRRYERGTVRWEVKVGDAVTPHQTVGWVSVGPAGGGAALNIAVDHFGTVTKLLVPDGAEVSPQQALLEYDARSPITDEYWQEWERADTAERRERDLLRILQNPFRAFWAALTRSHGRE